MHERIDSYDALLRKLILQAKHGDQDAFEELLKIYDPLLRSLVNRAIQNETMKQDAEDIKQELTVAFYNAILSYDIEQCEVSFGLYAKICLNNALITQIRATKKQRGIETVSLEAEVIESVEREDPSEALIKKEEMHELNKRIEQVLSPFECDVWRSYIAGCSSREIAETLGKSEKSIDNAIFRIRQKLKPLFFKT